MRRRRLILVLCVAAAAVAVAPSGAIARQSPVVADCYAHNALQHHYTIPQLRHALATMPADIREYTSCYQIIQDQLFRQLGKPIPGSGGGSGSGGSFISVPVLIVIIVIVLGGGAAAYAAYRRRPPGDGPPPPDGPPPADV